MDSARNRISVASAGQGFISILPNNLEVGGEGSCRSDPQVLPSLCRREEPPLASSFLWFIASFHARGHLLVQGDCSRAAVTPAFLPARTTDGAVAKGRCLPLLKEGSRSSDTTLSLMPRCWAWLCGHTWLSILLASALYSPSTTEEVENVLGTTHGPAVCVISGLPGSAVGLLFLFTSPLSSADPKISPQHQVFHQDKVRSLMP